MGMVPSWHMVVAFILAVVFVVFCVVYTVAGLIFTDVGTGWWVALCGGPVVAGLGFWLGRDFEALQWRDAAEKDGLRRSLGREFAVRLVEARVGEIER